MTSLTPKEIKDNQVNILTDTISSAILVDNLPEEENKKVLDLLEHQVKSQSEDLICDSAIGLSKVIINVRKRNFKDGEKIIRMLDKYIQRSINQIEEIKTLVADNYLSPEKYFQSFASQLKAVCQTFNKLDENIDTAKFINVLEVEFDDLDLEYKKSKKMIQDTLKKCVEKSRSYTYRSFQKGWDYSVFMLKGLWNLKYRLWFLGRALYSVIDLVVIPGDLEYSFAGILRVAGAVCIAFATDPILLARGQRMIIDVFGFVIHKIINFITVGFFDTIFRVESFTNTRFYKILYYIAHYYMRTSTKFLQEILKYICFLMTNVYPIWQSGADLSNIVKEEILILSKKILDAGLNGLNVLGNVLVNLPSETYNVIVNSYASAKNVLETVWDTIKCFGLSIVGGSCTTEQTTNTFNTTIVKDKMEKLLKSNKFSMNEPLTIPINITENLVSGKGSALVPQTKSYYFTKAITSLIPQNETAITIPQENMKQFTSTLKEAIKILPAQDSAAIISTIAKVADEKDGPIIVNAILEASKDAAGEKLKENIDEFGERLTKIFTTEKQPETDGLNYQKILETTKFERLYKAAKSIGTTDALIKEDIVAYLYILTILSIFFSFVKPLFG
jgi:hypothetical protein